MSGFRYRFRHPEQELDLVITDDGKVAYAYLLQGGRTVADVWLYNRAATPELPEWRDRTKLPFLNPADYCVQPGDFAPLETPEEVSVRWARDGATIEIRGAPFAQILIGQKPGMSRFATQDGPLARRWTM